jgi:superfamily II DNA or RNA helicase
VIQTLRPYQQQAVDETRAQLRTHRRVLIVAPTGAGKTTIGAEIIRLTVERGRRVWFLAHRKELIEQCSTRLDQFGIRHGVVMGQHWRDRPHELVQVASVQTLINRDFDVPPSLIMIDEAHRATANSYQTVITNAGNPCQIGLTATPIRGDGKGLASMFDAMVHCPPIAELIAMQYLVPPRSFAGRRIDLHGVRIAGNDYDRDELADAMNKPHLVGDVVTEWVRLANGRPTMVFAAGVKHSRTIVEAFLAAGIKAAHLDGETPKDERSGILQRLADSRLTVVSNAMVLTEGVDVPVVSAVVLARPTKSKGLYLQMAGRGLRTAPGKTDCLILDHGNCTMEHGLVTAEQNWQLLDDSTRKPGKSISYAETFKVCPDCGEVAALDVDVCACGYVFSVRSKQKPLRVYNGVLEEVTEKRIREYTEAQRKRKYFQLLRDQHTDRKKDGSPFSKGYAFVKYEGIFKTSPESGWRAEWNEQNAGLIQEYADRWADWLDRNAPYWQNKRFSGWLIEADWSNHEHREIIDELVIQVAEKHDRIKSVSWRELTRLAGFEEYEKPCNNWELHERLYGSDWIARALEITGIEFGNLETFGSLPGYPSHDNGAPEQPNV